MNFKKLLNPSGMVQLYHSEKCSELNRARKVETCVCAVMRKVRERVNAVTLLESKEWRGSAVEPCEYKGRAANKLTHPSGAVAYVYA